MRSTFFAAMLLALPAFSGGVRAQNTDLLLVLAADVSRSIDEGEFDLQRKGYAAALSDPRVLAAIRGVAFALQVELAFVDAARDVGGENEQEIGILSARASAEGRKSQKHRGDESRSHQASPFDAVRIGPSPPPRKGIAGGPANAYNSA